MILFYLFYFYNTNKSQSLFVITFATEIIINIISLLNYILEYGDISFYSIFDLLITLLCFSIIILAYFNEKVSIKMVMAFLIFLIIKYTFLLIDESLSIIQLYLSGFGQREILKLCVKPIYNITYYISLFLIVPQSLNKIRKC